MAAWVAVLAITSARPACAQSNTTPKASGTAAERLACADAFEQTQRLRMAGHYVAASREVSRCISPRCGAALSSECSLLQAELEQATPSVVLQARQAGSSLSNVRVYVDDDSSQLPVGSSPVPIDPGDHTFMFVHHDGSVIARSIAIGLGEQLRSVVADFETPPPPAAPVQVVAPAGDIAHLHAHGVPAVSYVLAGMSVAAFGAGVAFGLLGSRDYAALKDRCSPACAPSEGEAVRERYTISDWSFGASAVLMTGAIVVYIAQPKTTRSAWIGLQPSQGGFVTQASTRF